jgi:hypothetical protein
MGIHAHNRRRARFQPVPEAYFRRPTGTTGSSPLVLSGVRSVTTERANGSVPQVQTGFKLRSG